MVKSIFATLMSLILVGCSASELTVEQKAAKLLVVGVIGNTLNDDNPIIRDIEERGISGVILFENNISPEGDSRAKLRRFIDDIQSKSDTPLFVAIDQEGGLVNRLKSKYGFADMPSQQMVASARRADYANEVAALIASEVASIGVNINFTPCVDLNINPDSPAIGRVNRSFSDDEQRVVDLATIYVEEHRKRGVITSLKHFPGHGSAKVDSHLGLTDITTTWEKRELIPYREMIASGNCDMVMVSHLYHHDIDSIYPASLSKKSIDGLLRTELGWDGVVVSDDMQMRAITDEYGFADAVIMGLNAGVDLFVFSRFSNSSDIAGEFIDVISEGVKSGKISEERLNQAVERVLTLRKKVR
ncbi:MAG: glycoside hydrolase family 3 N-terminal domain-containing protein [Rikenellaceae bacterium]